MRHPLEFVPNEYRKRLFFAFLFPTLILFGIFRVLDEPLQTSAAPAGIVSFELARTPEKAANIMISWSRVRFQIRTGAYPFAVFGLGLDYLFMPLYTFTLAFGTLLVAGRHGGWFKSLGAVAGCGAFVAAAFDAVENYALFQVLLGKVFSPYPEIAFYCAVIKFGLLIFGLIYAIAGSLLPGKSSLCKRQHVEELTELLCVFIYFLIYLPRYAISTRTSVPAMVSSLPNGNITWN